MRLRRFLFVMAASLALVDAAGAQTPATLNGQIVSADGAMEGVLVSAKKTGSTITITVVSDGQ